MRLRVAQPLPNVTLLGGGRAVLVDDELVALARPTGPMRHRPALKGAVLAVR
jgi:hypothetical protein